jgi:hypothetical protein
MSEHARKNEESVFWLDLTAGEKKSDICEFRSRQEERRGDGVKNPIGS